MSVPLQLGQAPVLPKSVERILVILPSWVGDVCMATPVVRHLAATYPAARIVLLGRPMLAPLVAGLPFAHAFIGGSMRGLAAMSELRAIHRERFDTLVLLPNSFRSALFGRLTGIPHRAGSARDGRSWLLSHPFHQRRGMQSAVDSYADLAEWCTGARLVDRRVELAVTAEEQAQARLLLDDHATSGSDPARNLILLNPGANRLDKRWPAHAFARAALAISAQCTTRGTPRRIAVTGNPSESALCADVARACGAIDLCARGVTLGSLKAILQRTALLISNDTGPRSIAAALGTPTIALFGPTDCRWTPLDYPNELRLLAEPFVTETSIADDHKKLCAIDRISVADVVAAVRTLELRLAAQPSK